VQQAKPKSLTGAELDELAINTIRTLSIDAVQQANSGHPGTPMALAPLVYVIWNEVLNFDPQDPIWPNRASCYRTATPPCCYGRYFI
jgi:transketolase N-terminal domain/subunit